MRCDVGGNCAAPFSICTAAGRAEACEQQHSGRVGYFNKSAAAYLGQSQSGAEECPALEAWRAKQLAPLRIPFLLPPTRRAAPRMSDTAAAICERSGEPLVTRVYWRRLVALLGGRYQKYVEQWCSAAIDSIGYWIAGMNYLLFYFEKLLPLLFDCGHSHNFIKMVKK